MTPKGFVILLIVTVIAAGGAAVVVVVDRPPARPETPERLVAGLGDAIDRVAAVEVEHGGQTLRVERRGEGEGSRWVVATAGDYPARAEVVRDTLRAIADLAPVEPKTDAETLYRRLGLDEPGEGSRSTLVRALDTQGAVVGAVVLGDRPVTGAPDSIYARVPGVAESWLVTPDPVVPVDLAAWVDTVLARIDRTRVREVRVTHPDGDSFVIARGDDPQGPEFEIAEPEGASTNRLASLNNLARALTGLRFRDARVRDAVELDDTDAVVAEFALDDGMTVTVRTWDGPADEQTGEDRFWLTLVAEVGVDATERIAEEAGELNGRAGGMVFLVTDFSGNALRLRGDDLIDRMAVPITPRPDGPEPEGEFEAGPAGEG